MTAGLDPEPAIDLVHYRRTFRAALRFGIGVGGGTDVFGPKRGTEPEVGALHMRGAAVYKDS
jgi:hypothetical protein